MTYIHNSVILEPYTVYGSGRYRERFPEYLRLMLRSNAVLGLTLNGILLLICLFLLWLAPEWMSRALLGLALTVGFLLSGLFLRRVFYVQRQVRLATEASLLFFITVACGLWLAVRVHILNSFSGFVILAVGWIVARLALGGKLALGGSNQPFLELEPTYWTEHWKYSRWVLATAFVYQLATQGYYWLVAGFLSVEEVGELRAMYLLVAPVEQILSAIALLLLPAMASFYAMKKTEAFLSLWRRSLLGVISLTGLFALSVWMLGRPVMHVVYAGKFDGLAPLLYLLALSPVLLGVGIIMLSGLNAVEKPKLVFYGYACSAAATFMFGIALVKHFGLRGAVYGMLLSGATCCAALTTGFRLEVYNELCGRAT